MKLRLTGKGGIGAGYHLYLDDQEVTDATGVELAVSVRAENRAVVTYVCDEIEVDGDFRVIHRCGLEES